MMKKPKANEPNLRDKLSGDVLKAFADDFSANGVSVIEKLREKSPEKYVELAAKLIAAAEALPDPSDFASAKSIEDVGRKLLVAVGVNEYDATDDMIEQALKAHKILIKRLEEIAGNAIGELN
jgi:hypothetical protein